MNKVSILGCGWIGKTLQKILGNHYNIVCLSRDIELNINKYYYSCDTLVIAIPPKNNYIEVLKNTLSLIDNETQVILLSSISYYDGKALVVEAEILLQQMHCGVSILRLGGLMGYDRIAGKYTAGKTLKVDSKTNYVHRDDVVMIIERMIELDIRGEVFDVVAPIQSTKKVIFTQNAKQFGFEKTVFLDYVEEAKVLNPNRLCKILGVSYIQGDVTQFWR